MPLGSSFATVLQPVVGQTSPPFSSSRASAGFLGRRPGNPGWLVEGVADYIRFFKYEPGKIGRLNVERARYDRSYRVTAAFLAYVTEKYDKHLVRKLNQAMRAGEYKEEMFKDLTGKTVQELDEEWRTALRAKAS